MNNELYLERAKICGDCPDIRTNKLLGKTCGDFGKPTKFENGDPKTCGCVLYLKARMKDQSCPQNKW